MYEGSEYVLPPPPKKEKNITFFRLKQLSDNTASIISSRTKDVSKMEGKTNFSRRLCRLSGTGIVEKNHTTTKRMAARGGGASPPETVEVDLTDPDPRVLLPIICH